MTDSSKSPRFDYNSLSEAFPEVDPGVRPFGARVLVQIRTPKTRSAMGIVLPEETRQTELWNTQVAKVLAIGPGAFRNRDTNEEWPEGAWCKVGAYVRIPKYNNDRWEVPTPDKSEKAMFVLIRDLDILGEQYSNPLEVLAFI